MVDLTSNLAAIEHLMKLMKEYKIDEVACDYINIKKSIHQSTIIPLTDEEILDKHTQKPEIPPDQYDVPWENITETQLQEFSVKGRI